MARPKEITDEHILQVARRCLIESGSGVSAVDIAREVGVSHTTLFNRFGSKEGLMIAALGPSPKVPWAAALDSGPDDRPIRDQLIEHCRFHFIAAIISIISVSSCQRSARAPVGSYPITLCFG
jgi:AcrR family transcriptional regulator